MGLKMDKRELNMPKKDLTDYTPDPSNPNRHTMRGDAMLERSISEVGLGRSIVVDKNGYIIAGNSTYAHAGQLGFTEIQEVETDGRQLVVVRRNDLDLTDPNDRKARKLSYYDNRAGELGLEWDAEKILADLDAGLDLEGIFDNWELDQLAIDNHNDDFLEEFAQEQGFVQDEKPYHQSIQVHFDTPEDVERFARILKVTVTDKTKYIVYSRSEDE